MCCTQLSLLALLACASILGVYGTENEAEVQNSERIVGGEETTIQKHPYQVYLLLTQEGTGYKYQCGGSIVKNRCVITAAHCLTRKTSVEIRAGSTNASSGGTTYNSRQLISHPRYNSTTKDFDIGVIRLVNPIKLDEQKTSTAVLPSGTCSLSSGTNLTVTGWGDTEENGDYSPTLLEASVDFVPSDNCKKEYSLLTSRMLCAGVPEGGKGPCQGDSGGPLVITGTKYQVGIAAFGKGCARPGYPAVYTNLCNKEIQNWLKEMNCA